tara:strand:- start:798 stop:1064 length:267 start_codon:yes stop_codon:yes gene_type:complete
MKNESYTNVKLDNLEIQITPTDILGDKITYKVEFKANDWGEIVPNISCLATKVSINGVEHKAAKKVAADPIEENKKEKKGAKKNENKK